MADLDAPKSYGEQFEVPPKPAWLDHAVEEGLALIASGAWDTFEEVAPPPPLPPPPTMSTVAKLPDEFIRAGATSPATKDSSVEVTAQRMSRMGKETPSPAGSTPATPTPVQDRPKKKPTIMPEEEQRSLSGQYARPDGKVSFDWEPVLRTPLPVSDAPIPRFTEQPTPKKTGISRKALFASIGIVVGLLVLFLLYRFFAK